MHTYIYVCVCTNLTSTRLQFTFFEERKGARLEKILEIVKRTVYLQQCAVLFRAECRPRAGGGGGGSYLFKRVDKKTTGWTRPSPFLGCIFTLTFIETTPPVNKFCVATTEFFRSVLNLPLSPTFYIHIPFTMYLSRYFPSALNWRSRKN